MYIGAQLSLSHLAEAGVSHTLDELKDASGVNYIRILASDRKDNGPMPVFESEEPATGWTGFPIRPEHYRQTTIKPRGFMPELSAGQRVGLIEELVEEKKRRGIKLHTRFEMGPFPAAENFLDGCAVDFEGRVQGFPCFNNPNWKGLIMGHLEDAFRYFDLDGFLMMNESSFPLEHLMGHGGADQIGEIHDQGMGVKRPTEPGCFCDHCCRKATQQGIDVEKAREAIREFRRIIRLGNEGPLWEGLPAYFRHLFENPIILEWHRFQLRSAEEFSRRVAGAVKAWGPQKEFAFHVFHPTSYNPIWRIDHNHSRYADFCDIVTPVVYHHAAGMRYKKGSQPLKAMLGGALDDNTLLKTFQTLMGYDAQHEASYEEMTEKGMSHDWLARELARVKRLVNGKARIVAALGWDIARDWQNNVPPWEDDATVEEAVRVTCRAGVDGMVYGRGYPESTLGHIQAAGRALKEMGVWDGKNTVPHSW